MSLAVVKLGGSAATSPSLAGWLAAVEASTRPLVLVPGGGPFADCVRDSQKALGFSDKAAHAMALLAMEQFGHVLVERTARFHAARDMEEIATALGAGNIPVWFPTRMVLGEPAIPASWDITSDSLAAWLAGHLDAAALLLIKQTDDFTSADTPETLAARGVVDAAFAGFSRSPALYIAGHRHLPEAANLFASGRVPGERIALATSIRRAS
ncbi:MAG: dihydroneopterin aldolase [Rhizobiaceae bacterium]|nr:dihydroneopterin aldolase [Rhizobiaceae bacterium]